MAANLGSMVPNWLSSLGDRVRGNLEATVIVILLGAAMTSFTVVTHGLQWWQQAILITLFFSVVAWALIATFRTTKTIISPARSETPIAIPGALSDSDPRIYLLEIREAGDGFSTETPFVIENLGGGVAHCVDIQTMAFGYAKVDFFRLDNLPIGVKKEIVPQVRSAEMDKRSILGVLRDAWNEKGKAENTILPNFEFNIIIGYTNFRGDRRIETTVNMTYSYMQESFKRNAKMKQIADRHQIFEIVQTNFRLLSN
jgi:hypothetical protein